MWDCHHRLEIQGQFRNSPELLKKCGMYYNVPAWQLILLPRADHQRIHHVGAHRSAETREKLSIAKLGNKNPNFGKHLSEKTKKKLSMALSGEKSYWFGKRHSDETRKKISKSRSGKLCGEKHPMFGKCGEKNHVFGTQWWNNGVKCVRSRECPGEGWVKGRKKTSKKTK